MITRTKITLIALSATLFSFAPSIAQEKSQRTDKMETTEAAAQPHAKMSDWAELKEFHEVMAQTFHPSEEGNLKPIRERSGELHKKAVKLSESKIPADFNTPKVIEATKELSAKTKELDELVKKKGTDADVTKLLTETHDSFHKIVGLCKNTDGEEKSAH